jgi:hypothetical protein
MFRPIDPMVPRIELPDDSTDWVLLISRAVLPIAVLSDMLVVLRPG